MTAQPRYADRDDSPTDDHIIQLHGVTWADYERLLAIRGDHSAPRIAYLHGTVEIMSPSQTHESVKSMIGCLVETWCLERGIPFLTVGSWTLQSKPKSRGVEPDESYLFGDPKTAERPQLAIEVVWTAGRIDKLAIYRRLGVAEVWFWRKGRITPYALRGEHYVPIAASEVLPGLDLELLTSFLGNPTTFDAIRGFQAALRAGGTTP